jgi:hypothetical protein
VGYWRSRQASQASPDIASVTFESASHAGDAIVELGSLHLAVAVGH